MATDQSLFRLKKPTRRIASASLLYRPLDAVLTASLRPHGTPGQLFWSVIRPKSTVTNRIASLVNLIDCFWPGFARRVCASLLRFHHFPLYGYQARLYAYGSGSTVFLLENGQDTRILKIYRRSLGQPVVKILEVACEFQEKHNTLKKWFNDPDEIVAPSTFLVLHSPLMGIRAAAVLQPYISGKKYDLFYDFNHKDTIHLLKSNPVLKTQWIDFSTRFIKSMEENNRCFDLVGRENLMLVEREGDWSFKIADNGVFDLKAISARSPALYARTQAYVERLKEINKDL